MREHDINFNENFWFEKLLYFLIGDFLYALIADPASILRAI